MSCVYENTCDRMVSEGGGVDKGLFSCCFAAYTKEKTMKKFALPVLYVFSIVLAVGGAMIQGPNKGSQLTVGSVPRCSLFADYYYWVWPPF